MAELRCPKCAAINPEGMMDFPRCHRCHENLRQCLYCRHFAVETAECAHETAREAYALEGERGERCEHFESRYQLGATSPRTPRVTSWMLVLAVAMIVSWVAATAYLEPGPYLRQSVSMHLTLDSKLISANYPATVFPTTPFKLRLFIYNNDPRVIAQPLLRFRSDLFTGFLWETDPQPRDIYPEGGFRYFVLDPLPPSSQQVITFTLTPRKEGTFRGRAELIGSHSRLIASTAFTLEVQTTDAANPPQRTE